MYSSMVPSSSGEAIAGAARTAVAGMHAGFFDVFHHAGDQHVLAIASASTSTSVASSGNGRSAPDGPART